ncbi:hypothetical protein BKA81DRAFT_365860 [Phyllosticta paracitricarpa]
MPRAPSCVCYSRKRPAGDVTGPQGAQKHDYVNALRSALPTPRLIPHSPDSITSPQVAPTTCRCFVVQCVMPPITCHKLSYLTCLTAGIHFLCLPPSSKTANRDQ